MVNKQHQLKARFRNLAGIILLFVVMVTVIAVSPLTDASAASSGTDMTITKDLVLEWKTTTDGNPYKGRHFRTTYWTFSVYKEGSDERVGYVKVPVDVIIKEGTSTTGTTMIYKWDLQDTTDKYYKDYAKKLVRYINSIDGDVIIKANPTIEFYDNSVSPEKIYKTVTTKSAADSYAKTFFGNSKSYFDNYFNKEVEIEAVRIRVKTKAGDTDSYEGIDIENGTTIGETSVGLDEEATANVSKKAKVSESVWYALSDNATPKIVVQANDGYIFTGAETTSSVSVSMETTSYGNGSGKISKLTTNTTVAVEATPVKVKIVYYVDEDGSGNYVKAGSDTCEYAHMGEDGVTIGTGLSSSYDKNYYTTWTYTDTKNNVERTFTTSEVINNKKLWTLWQRTGDRDVVTHTVNLYAESSNPPADSDYKIVYDGNGATSGSMTDQYATYGTTTMLKTNAYTKTGYHTDKDDTWVSEKNSVYYAEAQSVSDSTLDFDDEDKTVVTLDANWKPNECTIVYNGNGATSGTVKSQTITYGDWTTTLRENKYSKSGYTANSTLSWNTEPDGSGTTFTPGKTVTKSVWKKLFGSYDANGAKITLYAVWGATSQVVIPVSVEPSITYINPLDNEIAGPYSYEWETLESETYIEYLWDSLQTHSVLTLKECMFGTKYSTATTKSVSYSTGFQTTTEEQNFMIAAGSTVYKGSADEDWYTFEGWSVDPQAEYGDSDSIIFDGGQAVNGKTVAWYYFAYAMAYKYPIKYNRKHVIRRYDGKR